MNPNEQESTDCQKKLANSKKVKKLFIQHTKMSDKCPICEKEKFLNPQMKLLLSPCSLLMCDVCVRRIFSSGMTTCPLCTKPHKKIEFIHQFFEDPQVENEIQIRSKYQKYFNKRQQDFKTLKEYNDYLEQVEDLSNIYFIFIFYSYQVFNMVNGIDVQETEEKIENFKRENKEIIQLNSFKQASVTYRMLI